MIIKIENSPIKNKRFRVYMNTGKYYDFGLKDGSTFIDHHDEEKRQNYLKRHLANPTENRLISELIPSPSLFSAFLLWGIFPDLHKNISYLNQLFANKYHS